MGRDPRVTVNDWRLVQSVGKDIWVGSAFAFLGRKAFDAPGLAWVASLTGRRAPRPVTISLLGPDAVDLPGAALKPLELPALRLASVTSDKALYREGRDAVRLLALDPLAPGAPAVLEVRAGGAELARHPIRLDARGAATATLCDLPTGDYEVRFRGAPVDEPACAFTVAEYRLAPLVAGLVERRLEGEPARLRVRLRLETFGVPVEGDVRLELADRGRRVAEVRAVAHGGLAEAAFALTGEGPHAVNVQLADDPGRTATVPIVGSRAAERARTTFSTLGVEVFGSLLPSEGARPVRGLYLEEGGQRAVPFRLERVDTRTARLIAGTAAESVRVVVLDATCPVARPGAVERARGVEPARTDERYREGARLFEQKKFDAARAVFEAARAALEAPHPNYAYYLACCHARLGDKVNAVACLRAAFEDGWSDLKHLAADEDLAALRGYAPYEALTTAGRREVAIDAVPAGGTIEIACPGPVTLLAVGAFADGAPWEGWAALLAPEDLAPAVRVPERCVPGSEVAIEVETGRPADDAAVYLVVKDARLLTADTPVSRLAGQVKAVIEASSKRLAVGPAANNLLEAAPAPLPPPLPPMAAYAAGAPPTAVMMPSARMPMAAPARGVGFSLRRAAATMGETAMGPAASAPEAAEGSADLGGGVGAATGAGAPRVAATTEEPEVVFAGLLTARGGRAHATVRLGPGFADYVAEAFVLAGLDWSAAEARFRAVKEPFVALDLPPFCHAEDTVIGRAHVGGGAGARLRARVTKDGLAIPVLHDGRPLPADGQIAAARAELTFLAGPGDYVATVEEVGSGAADRVAKRIDPPGKLRRIARTLRLLEPGERITRDGDPSLVSLRILPGLERPFGALVEATADYGHACCEQTAAKLLAACSMYALAGDDGDRRARAESIILAGVRREASMWLRGRGFRMYPESAAEPHAYYGPKAARYLRNLALLKNGGGGVGGAGGAGGDGHGGVSPALAGAIDEGLAMAEDASKAYRLEWPPRSAATCEEAYAVVRFGDDAKARAAALVRARERAAASGGAQREAGGPRPAVAVPPWLVGAVAERAESSFAAAALFRGGGAGDRRGALALANSVVKDLGDEGRLYSTVDSVAAIALMSELRAARVVVGAGAGKVDVDGRRLGVAEASEATGEIRTVTAVEGVVAVEVGRLVEEDWSALAATAPVLVTLEKGGRAARRCAVGDALDLRVKLERGRKDGDLVWVCLPDALSRVVGGGQVKRFAVDFEGRDEVVVSLAATSATVDRQGAAAPQRFAACVRNMFEEERAGNPGPIEVTVAPVAGGAAGSALGRALEAFRRLFGGA